MNGSLTGNAWKNLLREAKKLTLDVLLIQEHNLPVEDPRRLGVMRETARSFGYTYCHVACIPKNKGRGGTATLISDRVEVSNITSFDRCEGNLLVTITDDGRALPCTLGVGLVRPTTPGVLSSIG